MTKLFIENTHVTLDLVKSKSFPLSTLFCRIDWRDGHNPMAVTGEVTYVPNDFIESAYIDELHCHKYNLMQTATGYGNKLATRYKVTCKNGKTYRVYCRCYSNVGTLYILIGGYEKVVNDSDIESKLVNVKTVDKELTRG